MKPTKTFLSSDIKSIQLKRLSKCIDALIDSEIALSWRSTYHPQQQKEITIENNKNITNLNMALQSLEKML